MQEHLEIVLEVTQTLDSLPTAANVSMLKTLSGAIAADGKSLNMRFRVLDSDAWMRFLFCALRDQKDLEGAEIKIGTSYTYDRDTLKYAWFIALTTDGNIDAAVRNLREFLVAVVTRISEPKSKRDTAPTMPKTPPVDTATAIASSVTTDVGTLLKSGVRATSVPRPIVRPSDVDQSIPQMPNGFAVPAVVDFNPGLVRTGTSGVVKTGPLR